MNKQDLSYKLYESGVIAFEDYQCVDCGGSNVLVDSFYACAVEIEASAGRDGWLACSERYDELIEYSVDYEKDANQYAESIRRGEMR